MRITIVTESFLPSVNGVTTSVCRVIDHLVQSGHEVSVIAPAPAPPQYRGCPVETVPSVPVRQFPVGVPTRRVAELLRHAAPDVVHLASPVVLGARGMLAAQELGIPTVAVYQTDIARYLVQHGGRAGIHAARAAWRHLRWIHTSADVTLAPSRAAVHDLEQVGIPRVTLWGRGVESLFHRHWQEDAGCRALRRRLAPQQEVLVGYVGRLAPEKEVHRLRPVLRLPGVRVVVVGDGPSRRALETALPGAVFLGRRDGDDLARAYGALDVFVHTGTSDTFGQTLQEAAACGLPVVAPATGGPLDLVEDGVTGLLFDPKDHDGLRSCVHFLSCAEDSWQNRALMGEAGAGRVASRRWSRLTEELLRHYQRACRRHMNVRVH
ncbi:GDP-mannose-dependent alpha-mannosyltransferase [Austwickia sp. TVS 96-490-7B]|nr:glycosyltransferase family 1 protein [Austwickia sp. TVS 96-490-7B]MBW3084683.1 GDP-mannose-dependent alpha-mannosyltransferase [Austwickia sp. TVS 96-490-7B]